jgi:tryptophan synthase alpha chain
VRTPEQATAIGRVADGVVVGSAIVDIIGSHGDAAAPFVQEFVATLRDALTTRSRETAV